VRLELAKVTAGYGDSTVLRDVDLVVPKGRVVALLGPNGAGKSTLLSVASGLLNARSGRVLLGGDDETVSGPEDRVERGLCHVTEGGAIFPGLTVAENLRMFSKAREEREAVERAVDAFPRLGERLRQIAGTMSGGEQRMLALARTYARRPSLILLDEISLGLAPIIVDEIFEFLRQVSSEGASLLVVEQYVAKVLAIADLAYLLVRGRIVFAGEATELAGKDIMSHYLGTEVGVGSVPTSAGTIAGR
jgi:branched-chain amino acid transport system ATP-binding protein